MRQLFLFLAAAGLVGTAQAADQPKLITKPEAFPTLVNPNCSHCRDEAKRRGKELRDEDWVLCWIRGYSDGGVIPFRFFLHTYRVISDSYGVFVHDHEAGYVRGFAPSYNFRFYGWRNGIMVMKDKDGTLYSCLTGLAFDGPRKGNRLQPIPTLVSDWGFWLQHYPQAVAYHMFDKYQPTELPAELNADARRSRGPADDRLPADQQVLGVVAGSRARAYPLETIAQAGFIQESLDGQTCVVLWHGPTRTAVAYVPEATPPRKYSAPRPNTDGVSPPDPQPDAPRKPLTLVRDDKEGTAPFLDKETGSRWDIAGRAVAGELKGWTLRWLDSTQVKWFAWAAAYPQTDIYTPPARSGAAADYQPLTPQTLAVPRPLGNLDVTSRRFAILKAVDPQRQRVTLLLDGGTEPKEWSTRPGAEVWCSGWWGRLDQFTVGDRVWVWFETDRAKQPVAVALLADELSEQDLYAPVTVKGLSASGADSSTMTLETVREGRPTARTVKLAKAEVLRSGTKAPRDSLKVGEQVYVQTTGEDARLILDVTAFAKRRAAQQALLRKRWAEEGLAGTLIFSHPERREVELLLDHEGMHWGRSLQVTDKVTLQAAKPIRALVKQLRPWRERTQVRLAIEGSDAMVGTMGQRVLLHLAAPPAELDDGTLPTGLGKARSKPERVEWLTASLYCTCRMHDGCAGHFFTLAACDSGEKTPCGQAKRTRQEVAEMIDKGHTDRQIIEELLKKHGPNLLRPHMMP